MSANPDHLQPSSESGSRKSKAERISGRILLERLKTPSIESRIDATRGPFIEVGAVPSNPRGENSLIDLRKINKRLVTSNIYQPETIETGYRHRFTGERRRITHRDDTPSSRFWRATGAEFKHVESGENWGTPLRDAVDFIGDATNLPVLTGSVGALYAIGLHPDAEPRFVSDEAPRTLEPGGILVLDGAKAASLMAENAYLDPVKVERYKVGNKDFANYAAIRNDVPYQPPQIDTPAQASNDIPQDF